jgi:parvulin-like peptidyl-prolyl isomerase
MQRWTTPLVGLAAVVLVLWIVARNVHAPPPVGRDPAARSAADAATEPVPGSAAHGEAHTPAEGGPLLLSDLLPAEAASWDAGAGATLFDGLPVPPLPLNAPRQVRFAVVLISYADAQPSASAAHPAARSRSEAKVVAERLLATAQQDFHAAVVEGDPGSSEDVGRVKVGILEPAAEYVLFTLPVDGVGGPVETPRGYWIVKRLE